jgi:hypothetical protein
MRREIKLEELQRQSAEWDRKYIETRLEEMRNDWDSMRWWRKILSKIFGIGRP